MEDIAGKLGDLLSDPEIMSKIQGLSGMFKKSDNNKSKSNSGEDEDNNEDAESQNFEIPPDIIPTILKIMPLLSSLKKEDKYTKFLKSLKPLLSEPRQEKIDRCSQIMNLVKILPLLKSGGLF